MQNLEQLIKSFNADAYANTETEAEQAERQARTQERFYQKFLDTLSMDQLCELMFLLRENLDWVRVEAEIEKRAEAEQ